MEAAMTIPIKEEQGNCKDYIAEENRNVAACNVKMEPKPEIPLLVLHSLPSVVSANPVEDDDFSAEGLAKASEKAYKPAPKSRKAMQYSLLIRNFQTVQKAAPIASDEEVSQFSENPKTCKRRARKRVSLTKKHRPNSLKVQVIPSDENFKSTHTALKNAEEGERKEAVALNHKNIDDLECAQYLPNCVYSDSFLKAPKVEEERCVPNITLLKEEITSSQWHQEVDSNVAYNRFFPDNEEKEGTTNSKLIHNLHNSEKKKRGTFQDPPKAQRGRRKGINKCSSQKNGKRKNKVNPNATENAPKQKPKKETKSELYKKCNKVSSVVSSDGKVPRGRKPKFASVKKVNSESFPSTCIKGSYQRKNEQKIMLCEYCSAVFTRLDYLKLHVMIHTNERPFKCDICKKSFRMRWRMRLHRRIHSNDKPYKCQFCSYCSIRKDALKAHCRNVHKDVVVCDMTNCLLEHIH